MLKAVGIKPDGSRYTLAPVVAVSVKRDCDTPADILDITLASELDKELWGIELVKDGRVLFEGIADEQSAVYANKVSTRIIGRSFAALLLDNEACPEVFVNTGFGLIFNRYARCCGFEHFEGENAVLEGSLNVQKGMSCYQVIKEFCTRTFGCTPYIEGRTLYPAGYPARDAVLFSDNTQGIPFLEADINRKNCSLVSLVKIKTKAGGNYDGLVTDAFAETAGVCRVRYADVSSGTCDAMQKPLQIIRNGRRNYEAISLVCSGAHTDLLARDAELLIRGKELTGYYVSSAAYSFKNNKETTRLTLRRKENRDVADIVYGKEY